MSDHFYTTSAAERDSATAAAYESEGVAGFVFRDHEPGPVPLYRAFNPSNGDHFYTANDAEYTNAVNNYDYLAEGTAGSFIRRLRRERSPFSGFCYQTPAITSTRQVLLNAIAP